jgi:hypothetical protein
MYDFLNDYELFPIWFRATVIGLCALCALWQITRLLILIIKPAFDWFWGRFLHPFIEAFRAKRIQRINEQETRKRVRAIIERLNAV